MIAPRDATRGGVNAPARPAQRGRESPLSIDELPMLFAPSLGPAEVKQLGDKIAGI